MMFLAVTTVRQVNITYNLGDLADWVSAIGTVAAVVVSLCLANRRYKPKIVITFIWTKQFPKEKQMLQSQARFHSIGEMIANEIDQEILNECKFENNMVEKRRRSSQDFHEFVRTL
ncbi:hypothetical protein CP361_00565 [Lactobacillus sp. UMNPBX10]|nr:hypothetical protein CP361_00565 [Lactobacillus sp. UMNPBX10]